MKFDEMVDMYMEEFHSSVKRLGFNTNVTNNGPSIEGSVPDGFKGDTGMPTPNIIKFPKRTRHSKRKPIS